MIQINLLPWREQERNTKRLQFLIILGFFAFLTVLIAIVFHVIFSSMLSQQQNKNIALQAAITQHQNDIIDLEKKKEEKDAIEKEVKFLMTLRNKSFNAVRILNELTSMVPSTVSLRRIIRDNNTLTLQGTATSNLDITAFMKNLEGSKILIRPLLTEMSPNKNMLEGDKYFQIKAELKDE